RLVGPDPVLQVAEDLALEPDHEDHRHQQEPEGDERLDQDDQHLGQADVAPQQRVGGEDGHGGHGSSIRTSVTGDWPSISTLARPPARLACTSAMPCGTPASGTVGTVTLPRGEVMRTSSPAATPRRAKSWGLRRRVAGSASWASDGALRTSVPRS